MDWNNNSSKVWIFRKKHCTSLKSNLLWGLNYQHGRGRRASWERDPRRQGLGPTAAAQTVCFKWNVEHREGLCSDIAFHSVGKFDITFHGAHVDAPLSPTQAEHYAKLQWEILQFKKIVPIGKHIIIINCWWGCFMKRQTTLFSSACIQHINRHMLQSRFYFNTCLLAVAFLTDQETNCLKFVLCLAWHCLEELSLSGSCLLSFMLLLLLYLNMLQKLDTPHSSGLQLLHNVALFTVLPCWQLCAWLFKRQPASWKWCEQRLTCVLTSCSLTTYQ